MPTIALPAFLDKATIVLPCKSRPELFFAPDEAGVENGPEVEARIEAAREACIECPLMIDCREHARVIGETGIWGGETDEERAAGGWLNKRHMAPVKPPCGLPGTAQWHRRYGATKKPCTACAKAERADRKKRREQNTRARTQGGPWALYALERDVLAHLEAGDVGREAIAIRLDTAA